jgi:hypothetical protein
LKKKSRLIIAAGEEKDDIASYEKVERKKSRKKRGKISPWRGPKCTPQLQH